jgi:hypothetical protein
VNFRALFPGLPALAQREAAEEKTFVVGRW